MLTMEKLYDRLYANGKENLDCVRNKAGYIEQITWLSDGLLYSITERTGREEEDDYMLRINPKKTFDRWSNADIEAFYCNLDDLCFDIFEGSLTWIYRRLAQTYINLYADLCE